MLEIVRRYGFLPWLVAQVGFAIILLLVAAVLYLADAAVSCSNPTNGISDQTAAQTSYTTGSITPVSGELVLVSVTTRRNTTATTPTLSGTNGHNVTWTSINGLTTTGSALARVDLFRGVSSSSTAGTLTADYAGNTQAQAIIIVLSCSGVDQATAQGIVQNATDGATSGGTQSVTLSAFGNAANATALTSTIRGTPTSWTAEAGYTGFSSLGGGAGSGLEWIASNDTGPSNTSTGGGGNNWAAIGVEIKATIAAANQFKRRIMRF